MSFIKRKKEEKREEPQQDIPAARREPTSIGIFSGKGGCGKSSILSSLCVLLSALGYGCILIDLDIVNATSTSQVFGLARDVLSSDEVMRKRASVLHILTQIGEVSFIDASYNISRLSIPVKGNPSEGYGAKKLYILPAKINTPDYAVLLQKMPSIARDREKIYTAMNAIYSTAMAIANREGIKYILIDTPPIRPEARTTFAGMSDMISAAADQVDRAVLISNFDESSVHGLIGLIFSSYAKIRSKTDGFAVNMSLDDQDVRAEIEKMIRTAGGIEKIFFIRYDPEWASIASEIPPIVYKMEGASEDLVMMTRALGYILDDDLGKLGFKK